MDRVIIDVDITGKVRILGSTRVKGLRQQMEQVRDVFAHQR